MADLQTLARQATDALLAQQPVTVRHEPGWSRNGFPLPIKRNKTPGQDGSIVQQYRPLAILEYVDEVLSGALASRLAKGRAKERSESESSP